MTASFSDRTGGIRPGDPAVSSPASGQAASPLLSLGVFVLIFGPVLDIGIGQLGDTLSLLCAILIAGFVVARKSASEIYVSRPVVTLSAVLVFVIIYGIITSLLFSSTTSGLQVSLRPLRALIMFFGIYVFMSIYARRHGPEFPERLIADVYRAIWIHAAIMVSQFIWPSLRDLIYPYTFADQALEYNQTFRMAGLTNGGGAQISVFESMGILLFPFVEARKTSLPQKLINLFGLVLISFSIVLSGRSGFLVAVLFGPIAVILALRSLEHASPMRVGMKFLLIALAFALISIALANPSYVSELIPAEGEKGFLTASYRSLEFLEDSASGQLGQNQSLDELWEYLFLPESTLVLLFGDPTLYEKSYLMQARAVNSDVGYVIFLFGYGLVGSLLQYLFYVLSFLHAFRLRRQHRRLASIAMLFLAVILLFHAKEVFVFTRIGLSLTSFFMIALFYHADRSARAAAVDPVPAPPGPRLGSARG